MALTKVRLPVADIQAISNGNTNVGISIAGGDAVVTVGGNTKATFGSSANTLSQPTTVTNLDGVENIDLTVAAGATGVLEAIAASLRLWTTSAHTLVLGANSTAGLTIATDGKVTLGAEGTAIGHLVTKAYVDNAAGVIPATATMASVGHVSIPTTSGNLIVNWGTVSGNNSSLIPVTFNQAFPTAAFVAMAARVSTTTSLDRSVNVADLSTTGMNIRNNTSTSTSVYWIAIGY